MPFSLYFRCFHYLRYLQPPCPGSIITIACSFCSEIFPETAFVNVFPPIKAAMISRIPIISSIFFCKKIPPLPISLQYMRGGNKISFLFLYEIFCNLTLFYIFFNHGPDFRLFKSQLPCSNTTKLILLHQF